MRFLWVAMDNGWHVALDKNRVERCWIGQGPNGFWRLYLGQGLTAGFRQYKTVKGAKCAAKALLRGSP